MKNKILQFYILLSVLVCVFFFGCKQNTQNKSNLSQNQNHQNQNQIQNIKCADSSFFVKVTPPENGVTGQSPSSYEMYNNEVYFYGVFVKNRIVKLSPYAISKYEVTYELWQEVVDWNEKNKKGYRFDSAMKGSEDDGSEKQPVVDVSWNNCLVWCNAYTEKITGSESECVYRFNGKVIKDVFDKPALENVSFDKSKSGFRLPTEAEWEFAARFQGNDSANAENYGTQENPCFLTNMNSLSGAKKDYNDTEENSRVAYCRESADSETHPVGEKAPNYLGLFDMSGNVSEWVWDWYSDSLETGEVKDPAGSPTGKWKVALGGSWNAAAFFCCNGYRCHLAQVQFFKDKDIGFSYSDLGFRLAANVQ